VIDWTIIDGLGAARKFGNQLLDSPRAFADRTSISGGIEFAAAQLERARFEGANRTIDISGDGTNNAGRDVTLARDATVTKGITINGLVILSHRPTPPWPPEHTNPPGGLEKYYQDNVIGGPGAFVLVAENFVRDDVVHEQGASRDPSVKLGSCRRVQIAPSNSTVRAAFGFSSIPRHRRCLQARSGTQRRQGLVTFMLPCSMILRCNRFGAPRYRCSQRRCGPSRGTSKHSSGI
jgi:hypothetical protein